MSDGYRYIWGAYGPHGPFPQAEGGYFPPRARNNPDPFAPPIPLEEGGLMPSYEAACDLYRGDPDAIWKVGLSWVGRAAIIGVALRLAGEKDLGTLTKYALAGSLGVEAFVVGWVYTYGPADGKRS